MGAVKVKLFALIERGNAKVETFAKFLVNAFAVLGEMLGVGNTGPLHGKAPFSGECLTWAASWKQIAHTQNIRKITTEDNEMTVFDWRQYPISRKLLTIEFRVREAYRRPRYKPLLDV